MYHQGVLVHVMIIMSAKENNLLSVLTNLKYCNINRNGTILQYTLVYDVLKLVN